MAVIQQIKVEGVTKAGQRQAETLMFRGGRVVSQIRQEEQPELGSMAKDLVRCAVVTATILGLMAGLYVYLNLWGGWSWVWKSAGVGQ